MSVEKEWLARLIADSLAGDLVKAESDLREALEILEVQVGRDSERLLPLLESLAGLLWCTDRKPEAGGLIERIVCLRTGSGPKAH